MAQWPSAVAALSGDPSPVSSTVSDAPVYNSSFGEFSALFWPLWAQAHILCVHTCARTHTYTHTYTEVKINVEPLLKIINSKEVEEDTRCQSLTSTHTCTRKYAHIHAYSVYLPA